MLSLVVLVSGGGSNLGALLERCADPDFPARVVAVGADREAAGLARAKAAGVPTFLVPFDAFDTRAAWGDALVDAVQRWAPDVVVLSGFMRLLPDRVVDRFAPDLINTHPAYLPEFPGAHAVRDALAAGVAETGASVIRVDYGVDSGPVLAQERVPVRSDDTVASLHERIKLIERRLLADVIERRADARALKEVAS